MSLIRLTYFSHNIIQKREMSVAAEIKKILDISRRQSTEDDLTGALIFNNSYFAQTIEGERQLVTNTFCRIASDPRHGEITIVSAIPIDIRRFKRWWMAFAGKSATADELYIRFGSRKVFSPNVMSTEGIVQFMEAVVELDENVISSDTVLG